MDTKHYFIIDNNQVVDVVESVEQADRRKKFGWSVVFDCGIDAGQTVAGKAHRYARKTS